MKVLFVDLAVGISLERLNPRNLIDPVRLSLVPCSPLSCEYTLPVNIRTKKIRKRKDVIKYFLILKIFIMFLPIN
jgi:hypothetical protein